MELIFVSDFFHRELYISKYIGALPLRYTPSSVAFTFLKIAEIVDVIYLSLNPVLKISHL